MQVFKYYCTKCMSDTKYKVQCLRPGLHDIGSLFMPDRFLESDTENASECGCLHKELYRIQEQSISDSHGAV